MPALVSALNSVDLPTLGRPTIPHLNQKLGSIFADDEQSNQYLAESIRKHPDQETLKAMVLDAGFGLCEYHNLSGGIVAVHKAIKT